MSFRKLRVRLRLRLAERWAVPEDFGCVKLDDRRHVYVALAADYGNLGDLAITHAQVEFLKGYFPGAVVVPLPISSSLRAIKGLRSSIGPNDLVTLIGGGNTGDMYDDIQFIRERFIRILPDAKIISFPQTVDFSSSPYGRFSARRAARLYGRHSRLGLLARDSVSAAASERIFRRTRVEMAPDVVLTLDRSEPRQLRSGCLIALRSDLERGITTDLREALTQELGRLFAITERDTHIGNVRLGPDAAQHELESYWAACRASEVMVTDRLHGMIFAVITGTPCVVLDSGTRKVSQFYADWLSPVPRMRLVKRPSVEAVVDAISEVLAEGDPVPNSDPVEALRRTFRNAFTALATDGRMT